MSGFRTKARAIDLLGEKQIKDEATAISELFKNAHDADAPDVELSIDTQAKALVLWDNGHGMTLQDVEIKWLTVGTDSKLSAAGLPKRTKSGRVMMGEKGIGRLAVATLGTQTLMITKTSSGPYVLAYIHWDVFTNGELFLEDTVVPVRTSDDIHNLERLLAELKDDQRRNIMSPNPRISKAWQGQYEDLGRKILTDVEGFVLHPPLLASCLERISDHGTLFYVSNLKEKWEALADPGQRGQRLKRKRESLSIMMSSFINTIRLFEGHASGGNYLQAFSPRLLVNGKQLVSAEMFEAHDLERYDYGLVGEISEGRFTGHHLVHQKPPEDVNVDLTADLDINDMTDCGPFRVSVFYVEGELKNSLLEPNEHKEITDKLDKIGGIYVYRDGLRVLPYGTPEHDFLEIEKRRTLKAGRYVFSMRNLFGYIAISKELNPGLEDKSSREGIRETPEYDYFRSVLIRLMVWWGKDFLNAQGRRDEERERKRKERELEELEKKRQTERQLFIDMLNRGAAERQDAVSRQAVELTDRIKATIPGVKDLMDQLALGIDYSQLWVYLEALDSSRRGLSHQIAALGSVADLPFRPQYGNDPEVKAIRDGYAAFITTQQQQLNTLMQTRWQAARECLQGELYAYLDRVAEEVGTPYAETFVTGLQNAVQHAGEEVQRAQLQAVESLHRALAGKADRYESHVARLSAALSGGRAEAEKRGTGGIAELFDVVHTELHSAQDLLHRFTRVDGTIDLKSIAHEIQTRTAAVGDLLAGLEEGVEDRIQRAVSGFNIPALDMLEQTADGVLIEEDHRYLTLLEEKVKEQLAELHEFRGLAITGTAAEILNHEFEQAYDVMNQMLGETPVRQAFQKSPELQAVYELLTHVQALYRRVKPIYRKARPYRRTLKLYDVVDQVVALFSSITAFNKVTWCNNVEPDFYVYENESVLYPVLVNLFNNAIYWMLTKSERTVLIRSNASAGALYVEDTGTGVRPEDADRLFGLFYTTRLDGRGIGLYIVRKLLADRKHSITVIQSEEEKRLSGACFRINFDPGSVRTVQ